MPSPRLHFLMAALAGTSCGRVVPSSPWSPLSTSMSSAYNPPPADLSNPSTFRRPSYTLQTHYNASNFFDDFDFFTDSDPTHGFVDYVNETVAFNEQLAGFTGRSVYLGVDSKTRQPVNGRRSVRLTSKQSFTRGLFIADLGHMPGGVCGVWPAFWMLGPNWPTNGEIDIIEGINLQSRNQITLHSSDGCTITADGSLSTTSLVSPVCDVSKNGNQGCGQVAAEESTYGSNFNLGGGGVYAMDWQSDHISVWFFSRWRIPRDIRSGKPDPSGWGPPLARFNGGQGCTLDDHFRDQSFVFDTTFCGDWAGQVWGSDPTCSKLAPTCEEYVAENPTAFETMYWLVNYIDVYQRR